MSLYGALFTGVSGLSAQSNAMGIISDNIANVNTIGYKKIESRFSSLVTKETTLTTHSPGGVRSLPYFRVDQQGLLQGSTSGTDLAIAGDGMFVVQEQAQATLGSSYLFTRAGSFNPDNEGNLVNAAELREELELDGSIFQTTSDTEVILHLMARNPRADVAEALLEAL